MLRQTLYGTLTVALLVVGASTAHAQFSSPIHFNVNAGAALPMGDFSSNDLTSGGGAQVGFRVGAGLELHAPLMPIGVRFDGAYDRMGIEDFDASYSIWSLSANAVLAPAVSPVYFIGGLGFYSTNVTGDDADPDSDAENDVGVNVGVGLRLPLTGFSTFIEARWNRIFTDEAVTGLNNIDYIPITFGIRF